MDELIDIVDNNGKPIGQTALKSIIHTKGYLHNTAHIWLYTTNGQILLAQRAASKIIYPLLWDVSVAGHIDAGETVINGAIREIKEEIGLQIETSKLEKIGVFECFQSYPNGINDNEFHNTFITPLEVDITNLKAQPEEVEALKLVTISEFKSLLKNSKNNGHFVATNTEYYLKVIQAISNKLP